MSRFSKDKPGARINTYSYYRGKSQSNSRERQKTITSKFSARRLIRGFRSHISFYRLVILLVALTALGFLISADSTPIIRFSSSGINPRDTSTYRETVKTIITGSLVNKTKLTFDYKSVEEQVTRRFPEIETARVTFDVFGRKPVVQLYIHPPTYQLSSKGVLWVLDDRGVIISRFNDLSETSRANLMPVVDEIGLETDIGKVILSPGEAAFVAQVKALLEKQLVSLSTIYIPTTPKEIDLNLKGETWRYRLNTEEKASDQAGSLLAARQSLAGAPTAYVDLRAGEKVYWK